MARKDVVAWECSQCGSPVYPEDVLEHAMESVSRRDVVTITHCPCGYSALLSFSKKAWNRMHEDRQAQLRERRDINEQRIRSEIGRTVAEFRRELETGDTLEDWGLAT